MKYILALLILSSCHVTRVVLTSESDVKRWTKEAISDYFKNNPVMFQPGAVTTPGVTFIPTPFPIWRDIDPGFSPSTPLKCDSSRIFSPGRGVEMDTTSKGVIRIKRDVRFIKRGNVCKSCSTLELKPY